MGTDEEDARQSAESQASEPGPLTVPDDRLLAIERRLASLEESAEETAKRVAFLPSQVRLLAGKIDGLATSISEPRYRAVLLGLLDVYDLVSRWLITSPTRAAAEAEAERGYAFEVVATQLRQLLEANGLEEVPTAGAFDPASHRAVERVPVNDLASAGRVVQVMRAGFRTEHTVLRYADVAVGHYVTPEPTERVGDGDGAEVSSPTGSDGSL